MGKENPALNCIVVVENGIKELEVGATLVSEANGASPQTEVLLKGRIVKGQIGICSGDNNCILDTIVSCESAVRNSEILEGDA